ncbi:MAG TPA: hypothetical protein VII11_00330 [Bacteroidota bacterium]
MPYTEKPLTDIGSIVGTFNVTLYYDSELGDLTAPPSNTILNIGEVTSFMERNAGEIQLDSCQLHIRDDYATYTEGFWYKVLNATLPPRIKILLDEGSGNTPYYYGEVDPLSIQWEEKYIKSDNTEFLRVAEFEIVSLLKSLENVLASTWLDEAYTHRIVTQLEFGGSLYEILKLTDFLASLLNAAGLNDDWSSDDATFIWDGASPELKFKYNSEDYTIDDLHLGISNDMGEDPTHNIVKVPYWDSSHPSYLGKLYSKGMDLLAAICRQFGLHPVFTYDGSRHILELRQKGHTYSGAITMKGGVIRSRIVKDFDVRVNAVKFFSKLTESNYYWESTERGGGLTPPPEGLEFDLHEPVLFLIDEGGSGEKLYVFAPTLKVLNGIQYYHYVLGSSATALGTHTMQEALCLYEFYRLAKRKKVIERTYGSLQADNGGGNTHEAVKLLARASINDGTGAGMYYINKLIKKPASSELEIEWIKE